MTPRRIAELAALLLLAIALMFALPMKAQNFRSADQVRLLSAIHISSPWSTYATDVWITNKSADPVSVSIMYGAANGPPNPVAIRDAIKLAPWQQCEFDDILGAATSPSSQCKLIGAPIATSGFGQIMFNGCLDGADCRDGASNATQNYRDISVASRVYSFTTVGGPSTQTVGQGFAAVPWWSYGDEAYPLTITGIRASTAFHTNIGLVNASDTTPVILTVTLYDGSSRGQRDQVTISLPPFGARQQGATELFPKLGERSRLNRTRAAANAYVTITSAGPDDGFFAYGSLIDSRSGDGTTLEATFGRALNDSQINALFGEEPNGNAFKTAALTTSRAERITDPLRFAYAGVRCSIEPSANDYLVRTADGRPWTHVRVEQLVKAREMCGAVQTGEAR